MVLKALKRKLAEKIYTVKVDSSYDVAITTGKNANKEKRAGKRNLPFASISYSPLRPTQHNIKWRSKGY